MMYKDSESYSVVKKVLSESVPKNIALKWHKNDNVLVVMSCNKKIFFLNEVAKDFLLLCDDRSLKEIVDELCKVYDVEKNILTDDLIALIQDLQYKRILYVEAA